MTTTTFTDRSVLTPERISEILGLTPATVRSHLKRGVIPGGVQVSNRWYLTADNLAAFLGGQLAPSHGGSVAPRSGSSDPALLPAESDRTF